MVIQLNVTEYPKMVLQDEYRCADTNEYILTVGFHDLTKQYYDDVKVEWLENGVTMKPFLFVPLKIIFLFI